MGGPSNPPEPSTNAYRKDLADVRLAGSVIASHYALGVERRLTAAAELHSSPSVEAPVVATLAAGDEFELLDDTRGWAWGYAGSATDGGRRVGYVKSSALGA